MALAVLKQRLIAKILLEHEPGVGTLAVKYRRFTEQRRIVGDPVSIMKTLSDQCLDEFIICSLGVIEPKLIRDMTDDVFTPVTVAGGIHSLWQVDELIRECGVDKVVIKDHALGWEVAHKYGVQAAVYPVDYRGACGAAVVPEWAGEVLLTSIDRDGTGLGYDLDALRGAYKMPVVVAGGCGKLAHVRDAFLAGADGAVVSSMFAFTDKSPIKLRSWLVSENINVRAA